MSNDTIWYGFLEAGGKSSPVVRDLSLETANPKTVYLYNLARGIFLEYAREIVEPKLRELKSDDIPRDELDKAFQAARQAFHPDKTVDSSTVNAVPAAIALATEVEYSADDDLVADIDDWDDFADEND
jgi:hypothetical protein